MTTGTPAEALPTISHYDVLEKIAEGSMGSVYKGRQRATGAMVALKIVSSTVAGNAVLLKRFEQEFRVACRLRHRNIVQALDLCQEGPALYLVMEFVEGGDLWQRIEREGRLPEREAVEVIIQVAQGLHEAHKQGIIHRDIKPDNILLTADGQAKLADLGLVKDLEAESDLTKSRSGMGTPNFIAPEQFSDAKHAGVRCDIYSLGATLYMAVTGDLPFHGRSLGAIHKKKLNNELAPPRQKVRTLSERADWAIRRAVQANPKQRYASCLEFINALTGEETGPNTRPSIESTGTVDVPGTQAKPPGGEHRAWVRYHCPAETSCNLNSSIHPDETEAGPCWQGTIQDISIGGIGLFLSRRFELGAILTVELRSTDQSFTRQVDMRVTRIKRASRGYWFLGGTFLSPLRKDELRKLL
jgi:serine/threonine protein kinase